MTNLLARLGKSAFLVLVAFGCTYLLWPHVHAVSLGTFYVAVGIASWRYGRLEGIAATALSIALIDYNFAPPLRDVRIDKGGLILLLEFTAIAITLSYFGSSRRKALRVAEQEANRLRSTQRDLAVSESRWRVLAESLPNLIWTCRDDGSVDYVSPQWRTYTGESPVSHVGYRWLLSIHPEDRDEVCRRWEQAMESQTPFEATCRLRSARGAYRWFKMRAVPSSDTGTPRWIGACTDVDDVQQRGTSMPGGVPRIASS